jgi:hypothetical protein
MGAAAAPSQPSIGRLAIPKAKSGGEIGIRLESLGFLYFLYRLDAR